MTLPGTLLRSCIRLDADEETPCEVHLRRLTEVVTLQGVDAFIVSHLLDIYGTTGRAPDLEQVREWCIRQEARANAQGTAALARLEGLEDVEPVVGVPFEYGLRDFREEVLRSGLSAALLEASAILTTGLQTQEREKETGLWKPKTLLGPEAAIDVLQTRMTTIAVQVRSASMDGEVRADVGRYQREVARRARQGQGVLSGIRAIDETHFGLQPGQLAFILAFTSHYKSTFSFNWAYRAAIQQKRNVGVVSLEMSGFALQNALTLMHCGHPRFDEAREGLEISSEAIKQGTSPEQQAFLDMVLDDLRENVDYGRIFFREAQTAVTMPDIRRWAEDKDRETPLDLLVIDYMGLVDLSTTASGMAEGKYLNQVVRQAKILASGFGGGRGIPILSPFQANREGYKDAQKNNGRYQLTAMAWANEAEKSADLVYSLYLNDADRAVNELTLGNLKARDGRVFTELPRLFVDPKTRLIEDVTGGFGGSLEASVMNL